MNSPPDRTRAQQIVDLLHDRPARLGHQRLVVIDGPAGSGKTTLAAEVAELCPAANLVHLDDCYAGWAGLGDVATRLAQELLTPLAADRCGRYHRFDWIREEFVEWIEICPKPVLIVEGVGSGSRELAPYVSVLVWVETDPETALARGLARDGAEQRDAWLDWQASEAAHFAEHDTRSRADLIYDI